jgi:hypothetical protein
MIKDIETCWSIYSGNKKIVDSIRDTLNENYGNNCKPFDNIDLRIVFTFRRFTAIGHYPVLS